MRLAFLAMLIAPRAWAAATPIDTPLKDDAVTTIECDVVDKTEPDTTLKYIGPSTPSTKFEGYHYDLYVPKGYNQNKGFKYPCMFIADAGGNANMGAMAERLKRDEWIVGHAQGVAQRLARLAQQLPGRPTTTWPSASGLPKG